MELFIQNSWIVIVLIAFVSVTAYAVYTFIKLPTGNQILQLEAWLLWAVAQAEKELGGGTGKLKLRYVYDMFLMKFPKLAIFITFEHFSQLVDEVLVDFREMLTNNASVANYVNKKEEK